jgi:homoaconitase/3-isopropylmalate dehydratase large subunit
VTYWRTLKSDPDAKFEREVKLDAREIKPQVTWGTSPEMVVTVDDTVPGPDEPVEPRTGLVEAAEHRGDRLGVRGSGERPLDRFGAGHLVAQRRTVVSDAGDDSSSQAQSRGRVSQLVLQG